MKIAIILSLVAIAYLTVWNWRRFTSGVRNISQRERANDDRMARFGEQRERVVRACREFTTLTGADPAVDPRWDFVNASYKNAVAAMTSATPATSAIKFDQAANFMQYAADHAERVVEHLRRGTCTTPAT